MATYTDADTNTVKIDFRGNVDCVKESIVNGTKKVFIDLRRDPNATCIVTVDGTPTTYAVADTDSLTFDLGNTKLAKRRDSALGVIYEADLTVSTVSTLKIGTTELDADIALAQTAAPTHAGTAQVGQTLTRTAGTYTGNNVTLAGQWFSADDGNGTNAAAISGATTSTYVIDVAYLNKYISYRETATESGTSNPETIVDFTAYAGPVIAA